jgi:hypothetical protein
MGDPDPVEPGDRGGDRRLAIIDVIGNPDRPHTGRCQRLAGDRRIGEEPLVLRSMPIRRLKETAFEIGEHYARRAEFVFDKGEWDAGIGDVHKVDVTGQDHLHRLFLVPLLQLVESSRTEHTITWVHRNLVSPAKAGAHRSLLLRCG